MTDYHEMTDDELRRAIAKRSGWRAVEREGLWMVLTPSHKDQDLNDYIAREPDSWRRFAKSSEDAVWEYERQVLPHWLTSTDAALSLFPDLAVNPILELKSQMHGWWVEIDDYEGHKEGAFAYDLPRAICVAWLEWQDKKASE